VWNVDPTPNTAGPLGADASAAVILRTQTLVSLGARVLIMNNPDLGVEAVASRAACSQSQWSNTRDRVVAPSSAAGRVSYWHVLGSPATPVGSAWVSITLSQTSVASARIWVSPEGFPAQGRFVTLAKGRPAHINMRAVEYGGLRIDSPVPARRITLTTTGFYPWLCRRTGTAGA
jgi:hypothetical protein